MEKIRDQFIEICNEALQAGKEAEYMNCQALEPYFRRLVGLANPDGDNADLKECFRELVRGGIEAPSETLAYCARALRYAEIAEASEFRLGDPPDPRWMNAHSDVLHALQDDVWEDAELWRLQS